MDGAINKKEQDYWDARYSQGSSSGDGSYGDKLEEKLRWLSILKDVETISEYGCGDFNFGKKVIQLFDTKNYTGTDISSVIIERNRSIYPQYMWTSLDKIPPADLVMCVDVLFHVSDEREVENILQKLETVWTKYLVISAYERGQEEKLSPHVYIRPFDPACFGVPILREAVSDDTGLYFYIFKK